MTMKQSGTSNPLAIIPVLAALAWLDLQTNGGQGIASIIAAYQATISGDWLPTISGSQLAGAGILIVFAALAFSQRGNVKVKALTVGKVGRRNSRLPSGMPRQLSAVVTDVLTVRGGKGNDGQPLFWVDGTGSTVTPLAWTLAVDYTNGVEPGQISRFVPDIENRLFGAGYDVQVRVKDKPLALEIDNPKPPVFALRDYWKQISALPQDERLCVPAVTPGNRKMDLVQMSLRNMGAGTLVAGMPGAGKTQFILSAVLSMCMANSPQRISLIIADMKAVDTMPLANLPHLAMPIVTDTEQIVTVLGALVDEMTIRMMRAAAGDRSFLQHSICVVVDEIAELIVGGAQGELVATHIQRLSQAGRGVGIILILATQRVFDIPAKVYSKIDRRCVFRVASAIDSVAASGSEGTRCNKLPKRGALEVFSAGDPTAQRAQGLFVADAEADDYEAMLHGFVEDIAQRWGHMQPAWTYTAPAPKAAQVDEPANELDALYAKYGDEFVDALVDLAEDGKLTGAAIGRIYQEMFSKKMDGTTRATIRETVVNSL